MNYKQSIYLHILTIFIVMLGSFDTVSRNLMGFSIIDSIQNNSIKLLLVGIIGISVFYHLFNKYTYLPFLNYNVLPYSLLKNGTTQQENKGSISIELTIPKDNNSYSHVIYWASNESKSNDIIPMWDMAYGEFTNSGIELVNNKKSVTVNITCPTSYKVPSMFGKKVIPKHIHYRFLSKDGMMSRVFTKYIKC